MSDEFLIKIRCDANEAVEGASKAGAQFEELRKRLQALGASYKDDVDPGLKSFQWNGSKAGETAEGLTWKTTNLKKIARELGHEFPVLGSMMRMALNPVVGAFTAVIAVATGLRRIFDDLNARSNTGIFAGTFRANIEDLNKTAVETEIKFRSFERALAEAGKSHLKTGPRPRSRR
jgi:hypothetical protein